MPSETLNVYPFLSAGVFFKLGSLPPELDTTDLVSNPGGSEPSLKDTPGERKGYMFGFLRDICLLTFYSQPSPRVNKLYSRSV